jgi:hypothetical protein
MPGTVESVIYSPVNGPVSAAAAQLCCGRLLSRADSIAVGIGADCLRRIKP